MVPKFKKGEYIVTDGPVYYVYEISNHNPDSATYTLIQCGTLTDFDKERSKYHTLVPALWAEESYRVLTKAELTLFVKETDAS